MYDAGPDPECSSLVSVIGTIATVLVITIAPAPISRFPLPFGHLVTWR
jgi:hypothetical protein